MDAHRLWLGALAAALAAVSGGCAARTLTRPEQAEALVQKNRRLEDDLLAARRRMAQLEAGGAAPAAPAPAPPADPFRAVAVRFGRFTGGLDSDGKPGCERLRVFLEPLDAEGDVVKRAGALDLELLEAGAGEPRLLGRWAWSAGELAQAWLSGFGIYAYVLKLDWPAGPPAPGSRLILRGAFTPLGGEALAAEKAFRLP